MLKKLEEPFLIGRVSSSDGIINDFFKVVRKIFALQGKYQFLNSKGK